MKAPQTPKSTLKVGEKIVIARDWSLGIGIRYEEKFPDQLRGIVTEEEWRHTISSLNTNFAEAETANVDTFLEGCLGLLTCFSVWLCMESQYEKFLHAIDNFLENENNSVYNSKGFAFINPKKNGYLYVSFLILELVLSCP